jgi:hypothetical protein
MYKKKGDRRYKKRRDVKREAKKKDMTNVKRCSHCGHEMRARGASDTCGGVSWKCKSKKCGRTVWERRRVTAPPVPVVPVSYMDKIRT